MARMTLLYAAATGAFEDAIESMYRPVAKAATAAIRDVGKVVKTQGRADMSAALSQRYANALRVNVYPGGTKTSVDAAAYIFHRIPYAEIYETGGIVTGTPFLWLPTDAAPKKFGREKTTPANYRAHVGKLRFVQRPGRAPMLVADLRLAGLSQSITGKFSAAMLRRQHRRKKGAGVISVAMFIGIPAAHIPRRTHIKEICQKARDSLPGLYFSHLNTEDRDG